MGCSFSCFAEPKEIPYKKNPLRLCYVYFIEADCPTERRKFIDFAIRSHPRHKHKIYFHQDAPIAYLITSPPSKPYGVPEIRAMAKNQGRYRKIDLSNPSQHYLSTQYKN